MITWLKNLFASRDQQFLFLHIPKCAGTSVISALSRVPHRKRMILSDSPQSKLAASKAVTDHCNGLGTSPDDLDLIMGHDVFLRLHESLGIAKQPFYFTFLRDPRERYLSHYHYLVACAQDKSHPLYNYATDTVLQGGQVIGIQEFAQSGQLGNVMTAYLAAANHPDLATKRWQAMDGEDRVPHACDALRKMDFVGFVDSFKEDMKSICDLIGVPFSAPYKNQTSARGRFENLDATTQELSLIHI